MERIEVGIFGDSLYTNFPGLKEAFVNQSAIILTPSEADRILFTVIVKEELVGLGERTGWTPGACGHTTYEHEHCLKLWLEREIEMPKQFADSRAALRKLLPKERIFGSQCLTRKDAEALVEQEIEHQRERIHTMDAKDHEYYESLDEKGQIEFKEALRRMHIETLKNAREELWAYIEEKELLIDEENIESSD